MEENENPAIRSNQEQEMDKSTKRRKVFEIHPIDVGGDVGAESCRENLTEKGVILTGKKVYRPPLPSTYKETELS